VAELFEPVATEEYFGHFAEQALEAGLIGMEAERLRLAIEEEAFEARACTGPSRPGQADATGDHAAAERFGRRPCGMSPNSLRVVGGWPRTWAAMLSAATWAWVSGGKPVFGTPTGTAVVQGTVTAAAMPRA
jgi:hypothetical protein